MDKANILEELFTYDETIMAYYMTCSTSNSEIWSYQPYFKNYE